MIAQRRMILVLAALVLILAAIGCGQSATYAPGVDELTALAESYEGEDKGAIQATAVARYLTAEAAQAAQEQAKAQIVALEATRQAAQDQERRQYMAMTAEAQATRDTLSAQATRQAMDSLATQQAWSFGATATGEAIQATAQAETMRATETAEARAWAATSTAEARNLAATATAQYKADLATATRQAWEARVTATGEAIQATAAAYAATATRAAEKREIVLGYGRDYGIPLVLLALVGGLIWLVAYGIREYKRRPVIYHRNVLGDAEPMAFPGEDGGYTLVDMDRQPGPVLRVSPDGTVDAPQLRNAGQEERTTARDQAVDAATRPRLGGGHHRGAGPTLPAPPEAPAPGLRSVRVLRQLDQARRAGFLPPPLIEALAADWEEE